MGMVPKNCMSPETCPYLTLTTIVATGHRKQANYSTFWTSSLPIRGTSNCGIEALSNLAPQLKQLHVLALWDRLCSRLGCRFWNGFRHLNCLDKTVINNVLGGVKLALKHMANAPIPTGRYGLHNLHFIIIPRI